MVDCEERHKFLKIDDLLFFDFDGSLQCQNRTFFGRLGLEHGLNGGLTSAQLLKLLLIILFLLLGLDLGLHHRFSAKKGVVHSLDIKKFSLEPKICLIVWILQLFDFLAD